MEAPYQTTLPEIFAGGVAKGRHTGLVWRQFRRGTGIAEVHAMKIDVNCNDDIRYWAARLGVSRAQLIAAVAAAGPDVRHVEARIRRERARQRESGARQASRQLAFHAYD
jgi:hypothetical protein